MIDTEARLRYTVRLLDPAAHVLEVTLALEEPAADGQVLRLPAWIPGSYLVREYARNVLALEAQAGGRLVGVDKTDKATWRIEPSSGPLMVRAEIYAFDLSVRGAWLDTERAFFNGTCLFLAPEGRDDEPVELVVERPAADGFEGWKVATALSPLDVDDHGFGTYLASSHDELIDCPVEIAPFEETRFEVLGVPHRFAVTGRHTGDLERLGRDVGRICAEHARLFGGELPMDRYLFLGLAVGEGYGGLEHRTSTALIFRRTDLPKPDSGEVDEGYRRLLGLCSHEYFHLWNVKRIRPAAFTPYRLEREAYTRLLWVFEGITSYYDDLALRRAGLVSEEGYLELLGQTLTRVQRAPGRYRQTLAESSFDAWIKFYRQDENAPNALVSYYAKGALAALALDLRIRRDTEGRASLDTVMRAFWERYGDHPEGVAEDGFERLVDEVTGLSLGPFFQRTVRSTRDLPLRELLQTVGVRLHHRPSAGAGDAGGKPAPRDFTPAPWLGTMAASGAPGTIGSVLTGSPAHAAGLSAGDEWIAFDGFKVSGSGPMPLVERYRPGQRVVVHVFRRGELRRFELELGTPPQDTCYLAIDPSAGEAAAAARRAWLGDA